MYRPLRHSTESVVSLGPFLSTVDGSNLTSLTINASDIYLSKREGALAVKSHTSGGTHDASGIYYTTLDTTDLNTTGNLSIHVNIAGALHVVDVFTVLPQDVYDSLVLGTMDLPAAIADFSDPDAAQTIATAVWSDTLSAYTEISSAGYVLNRIRLMTNPSNITLLSVIDGGTITVKTHDTWTIPIDSDELPDMSGYTDILFSVKVSELQDDSRAQATVRKTTGLVTVGGQDPISAANGSVVLGANNTSVIVTVGIAETPSTEPGTYKWWLKGLTPANPDGYHLAEGVFVINPGGIHYTA